MFFQNWNEIFKIVFLTVLFHISLIIILRIAGKRTLADLNAFDIVVTITIGSIFATTILSSKTEYFEGLAAIITLVTMQYIIAKISVNSNKFTKILKADPTLVYFEGQYLEKNMHKIRVTKDDITQQVRIEAGTTICNAKAVIVEPNGKLSVVTDIAKEDEGRIKEYKNNN
ncbi:MAG: DUF421 domain-containing protein [Senegalia sp. (in: firmicutes)]|uniref:DUF421 domain-containing protein n=2 Tax=Senegalia sp. (in: firmicutes) TaxID=1924098 RepID=UPI003F96D998